MDGYLSKPLDLTALLHALDGVGQGGRGGDADAAPREGPAYAAFDFDNLAVLEQHLPTAQIRGLLTLFLAQLDEQIAHFATLAPAGDWSTLGREAHTLAGAAGNIGAPRTYRIARALEAACGEPCAETIGDLVAQLASARTPTAEAIRRWSDARAPDIRQSAA
jgi:HPt (histidine-containing phosphotransfer) domain-containing protein